MHTQRERQRRELSGDGPELVECPACNGRTGSESCGTCGGAGWHDPAAAEDGDDGRLPDGLAESVGEFLEAWSMIQRYKVGGWLLLTNRTRKGLSPEFIQALGVFDGELSRLEHKADVERYRLMRDRQQGG